MRDSNLTIEKIINFEDFLSLKDEWNKVLQKSELNEPYLTLEWLTSWWKSFGSKKQLYILVVRKDKEICGIAPFMIDNILFFKAIKFIGAGWSDYLNIIILGSSKYETLDSIFSYLLENERDWYFIQLDDILFFNGQKYILEKIAKSKDIVYKYRAYTKCPFISIQSDWDDYLKSKGKNFKKYIRNNNTATRKLERLGKFEIKMLEKQDIKGELIDVLCDIEKRSWKARTATNHFRNGEIRKYFANIFEVFSLNNWMRLWLAEANAVPVAYLINYVFGKKVYFYLQAYDSSYKNAGAILFNHVAIHAFREKFKEIDLLRGRSEQKQRWTSNFRETHQLVFFKKSIFASLAFLSIFKLRWALARSEFCHRILLFCIKIKRKIARKQDIVKK